MEHQEYVTARHARLLEHAIELGCAQEEAAALVAQVLESQRREIARSDDPDPAVRDALARRVAGRPEPSTIPWTLVAIVVVVVLAIGAFWAWRQQPPTRVPSLFALDVETATRTLEDAGYRVRVATAEACEPRGLVLSSQPPSGSELGRGEAVTLRGAIPSGPACLAIYGFRTEAWTFVSFVRGGAAPHFAPRVRVYVDGALTARLDNRTASDRESWRDPLAPMARVADAIAPTSTGLPRIIVDPLAPPPALCGVPVPAALAEREALRVALDPSPAGDARCPVTTDLYNDDLNRLEAVAIYTGTPVEPSG